MRAGQGAFGFTMLLRVVGKVTVKNVQTWSRYGEGRAVEGRLLCDTFDVAGPGGKIPVRRMAKNGVSKRGQSQRNSEAVAETPTPKKRMVMGRIRASGIKVLSRSCACVVAIVFGASEMRTHHPAQPFGPRMASYWRTFLHQSRRPRYLRYLGIMRRPNSHCMKVLDM